MCAHAQPVFRPAHIELDVLLLSLAGLCADGRLWDGVVCAEDFEGFGVTRGAVVALAIVPKVEKDALSGRIPGMCEDDVVARVVLATATGSGGAGETEFEDHVGMFVGVVEI